MYQCWQGEQLYSRNSNAELPIITLHKSCCHVPTATTRVSCLLLLLCLWAPSPITGIRDTQRLSLARDLSGKLSTCQLIFFLFLALPLPQYHLADRYGTACILLIVSPVVVGNSSDCSMNFALSQLAASARRNQCIYCGLSCVLFPHQAHDVAASAS